ncbi:MAG: hypothetical protein HZB51_05500 [Chloroflexi bacterium]|nr:hypothetical protein [Chloroflexota bacterium]
MVKGNCHAEGLGIPLSELLIVVGMADIATQVCIVEWIANQAHMCQFFVLRGIIALMTTPARVAVTIFRMPRRVVTNRMSRLMTSGTE